MRVATLNTMKCPRCAVPIQGDYKYCPECACRLKSGSAGPESEPPPTRHGVLLLGLVAAALLAGGILVGWQVLGERDVVVPTPQPASSHYLRAGDIPESVVTVPEGVAFWEPETVWEAPPAGQAEERVLESFARGDVERFVRATLQEPTRLTHWSKLVRLFHARTREVMIEKVRHVPIRTRPMRMMRYEVTRGQWAEFLRAVERDPEQLRAEAWVEDFLRPAGRFEWAVHWRTDWWRNGLDRLRPWLEREYPDPATRPALEAPDFIEAVDLATISDDDVVKLLTPPSWLRLSPEGKLYWVLEEGSQDLPVTDISWWDAQLFVVWARQELGISSLRIPNWAEWVRAYHGNHPQRPADDYREKGDPGWRWPWGNVVDRHGCNNLNHSWNDPVPVLRDARKAYGWHEGDTVDGVLNMAGNAAEWTRGVVYLRQDEGGDYYVLKDWDQEGSTAFAFAYGGSYLDGLDDCSVNGRISLRKTERRIDVGFRLVFDVGL